MDNVHLSECFYLILISKLFPNTRFWRKETRATQNMRSESGSQFLREDDAFHCVILLEHFDQVVGSQICDHSHSVSSAVEILG